jgi:uroporphyrin-III C-methyltransferase
MPHDPPQGCVLLVGAGPGPADLMTVRALRAVESAQALLYDALVGEEILGLAPAGCVRIQTGKRAGRTSMKQETINRLMLTLARRGLRVVRLKGGDPSVFGRVGEESAFLKGHGVQVEIIPGVTAACAAAAQFDFPLTHRGEARRVVFATARVEGGELADSDWTKSIDQETSVWSRAASARRHPPSPSRTPASPMRAVSARPCPTCRRNWTPGAKADGRFCWS